MVRKIGMLIAGHDLFDGQTDGNGDDVADERRTR